MNFVKSLFIVTTFFVSTTTVHAEVLKGCAAKQHAIETQIKYAQSRGNNHEVKGLQKALIESTTYCNDLTLKQEREQKVLEKQGKISKLKMELQRAKENGNTDKIKKKQIKLKNAQLELAEAKRQLDS